MKQKLSTREDYSRRINIIVEYINNHLADDIDLEVLAGISNFSPYHFHRIFKAFLGEPIGAFIIRMKVETAARLLRYGDMSVQEIAYKVGYDVPSSLSKAFRQFYNITPTEYKNNKKYTIMRPFKMNQDLNLKERISTISSMNVIYLRLMGDYKTNDYCTAYRKLKDYLCQSEFFKTDMKAHGDSDAQSAILRMFRENTISSIGIYHDDPKITENEKLRADICLSVPIVMTGSGDVGFKEIEGGKYAIYLYQGPYEELDSVYGTVYGKYIPDGGYQIDMRPGFEVYLNDPESTSPEKLLTEIYVPVV